MSYQDNSSLSASSEQKPQMVSGDWTCSQCHGKINKLPFEPDPKRADKLLCLNCWKARKQAFGK